MDYKQKYLKYKQKYTELKNQMGGLTDEEKKKLEETIRKMKTYKNFYGESRLPLKTGEDEHDNNEVIKEIGKSKRMQVYGNEADDHYLQENNKFFNCNVDAGSYGRSQQESKPIRFEYNDKDNSIRVYDINNPEKTLETLNNNTNVIKNLKTIDGKIVCEADYKFDGSCKKEIKRLSNNKLDIDTDKACDYKIASKYGDAYINTNEFNKQFKYYDYANEGLLGYNKQHNLTNCHDELPTLYYEYDYPMQGSIKDRSKDKRTRARIENNDENNINIQTVNDEVLLDIPKNGINERNDIYMDKSCRNNFGLK